MLALTENPLLYREWRIGTRPVKFYGVFLAVFGFLAMVLLYLYMRSVYEADSFLPKDPHWISQTFAIVVLGTQFFIAFYVSLGLAMDAIPAEMQRNTHDFLVTLPVSAADKAVGLALGPNILPLLLLAAMAVPGIISWVIAGLPLDTLAWLYLIMLSGFVAFSFIGATVGQALGRLRGSWILVLIYLILSGSPASMMASGEFHAMPFITPFPFSTLIRSVAEITQPSGAYHFFSVQVPWQLCPLAFYVLLGGLAFYASCWKLQRPTSRPLPRLVSLLAFLVFLVLLVGFMADSARSALREADDYAIAYLVLFSLFVLLWGMMATPTPGATMVWTAHKPSWPKRVLTEAFGDLCSPPLVAAAVMWALAVLGLAGMSVLYWSTWPGSGLLAASLVMLVFLLAYSSIYMFGRLLSERSGIIWGVVFLLVAVMVPYSFSQLDNWSFLTCATPAGILSSLHIPSPSWRPPAQTDNYVGQSLAFSLGELAAFAGLCAWRMGVLRARSPAARKKAPRQ